MANLKYKDVFDLNHGIFSILIELENEIAMEVISDFKVSVVDMYIYSRARDMMMSAPFIDIYNSSVSEKEGREVLAELFVDSCKKELLNLKAVHDIEFEGVDDYSETETITEAKTRENETSGNGTTQNKMNAFNSETASDTDSSHTLSENNTNESIGRELTRTRKGFSKNPVENVLKAVEWNVNEGFLSDVFKLVSKTFCLNVFD